MRLWVIAICFAALPAVAWADPCEGSLPRRAGETFSGQVRYIGDGDSLCVGNSSDQAAKTALEQLALGRSAQCVATRGRSGRVISHDRVIATCSIGGRRIGDALRASGAREGGN